MKELRNQVEEVLSELIDPEAGVDVITLGLLESVALHGTTVSIEMVPTTPGCPLLHSMSEAAHHMLTPHFQGMTIDLLWRLDIEWTPDRMKN